MAGDAQLLGKTQPARSRVMPNLSELARRAMVDRGFLVEPPREAQAEVASKTEPAFESLTILDLSSWLWSSIDNDESRDLDQVEYAKKETAGTRLYIGVADVDWFVHRGSMLDHAAQHNTTSVYTGVTTFPMLPEKLSTDLSSLNEHEKRLAIVVEMFVTDEGRLTDSSVYTALVENKAQLTYKAVAAWLDTSSSVPPSATSSAIDESTVSKIEASQELQEQLQLQDTAAQALRDARHEAGALSFQTTEMRPVLSNEGTVVDLEVRRQNRAGLLIED